MPVRKTVSFAYRNSGKVSKWKVEIGQMVYHGRALLHFEDEENGSLTKFKSKFVGTVVKLIAKEGDVLKPGDPVLEVEEGCCHPTIINDLCAECGADLQREGVSESNATVPMVHHIPQLKVSQQEAEMIGKADTARLLRDRKLVLLVDLDQTLIHTTHDNIPNNIKDVHHFQLGTSAWYHTRLRPNTAHFLKEMSAYFELHICTFGVRPYAHMVANILDRDQSLFSNRILSRDECFNYNSKVANLQALFPNGDELVCIIDDRKDVWNNSPNLIPVKPYVFFTNTGDINDPNLPPVSKHSEFFAKGVKLKKREMSSTSSEGESSETKEECGTVEEFDVEDEDDYLLYLETILKKVHELFYKVHDKEVEGQPHVRWVLEQLRGSVLKGCEIVFSGLVPLYEGLERSEPYLMATDLGAKIGKNVCETTTHVVAARQGTAKFHESKKYLNIKIVNPQWLTTCLYRWELVDERLFPLAKSGDKDKKEKDEVPLALSYDDVVCMQQEVRAEFSCDSSDSDSCRDSERDQKSKEDETVEEKEDQKVKTSLNHSVKFIEEGKPNMKSALKIVKPTVAEEEAGPSNSTDDKKTDVEKQVKNIDKILELFKKEPVKLPVLDFLRHKNDEAFKRYHIPKRVRINETPEIRVIDNTGKELKLKTRSVGNTDKGYEPPAKKKRKHPKLKPPSHSLRSPKNGPLNDRDSANESRIKRRFLLEEHDLKMSLLSQELKNQTERHNLEMQSLYEKYKGKTELLNAKIKAIENRMFHEQKEHEMRIKLLDVGTNSAQT